LKPPEYDEVIRQIDKIPEKWNSKNKKINFKIIAYRDDATWVSSRIYEEVDRNLISVEIQAKSSEYSIELDVTLIVVGGIVAKKSIDMLLEELRDYLKRKWRMKQRRKRKNKDLRE
jgi:hypothetical protein